MAGTLRIPADPPRVNDPHRRRELSKELNAAAVAIRNARGWMNDGARSREEDELLVVERMLRRIHRTFCGDV